VPPRQAKSHKLQAPSRLSSRETSYQAYRQTISFPQYPVLAHNRGWSHPQKTTVPLRPGLHLS
jgi:hypothetical protein